MDNFTKIAVFASILTLSNIEAMEAPSKSLQRTRQLTNSNKLATHEKVMELLEQSYDLKVRQEIVNNLIEKVRYLNDTVNTFKEERKQESFAGFEQLPEEILLHIINDIVVVNKDSNLVKHINQVIKDIENFAQTNKLHRSLVEKAEIVFVMALTNGLRSDSLSFREILNNLVYKQKTGRDIVKHLLEAKINHSYQNKEAAVRNLIWAAEVGDINNVSILLEVGIDVNATPRFNGARTALESAAFNGHQELVKWLLKHPKVKGNYSNLSDALMLAASQGHKEIVKMLLNVKGININRCNLDGKTALILASDNGHTDIVKILLNIPGIDVNIRDEHGMTALMHAAFHGHKEIIELLLKVPNIRNITSFDGEDTALDCAMRRKNNEEIISLLQKKWDVKTERK